MGRLIREKQFATEVEAERYCASSCPLVLAKGVEWRAGFNAAIGVHQVSSRGGENISASAGMENAQQIPRRARNTCATWVSIWRSDSRDGNPAPGALLLQGAGAPEARHPGRRGESAPRQTRAAVTKAPREGRFVTVAEHRS
jgi:hypothetical protein